MKYDRLSWVRWVKYIIGYIPAGARNALATRDQLERTTKTQRTQRLIAPIYVKLITQRIREPVSVWSETYHRQCY